MMIKPVALKLMDRKADSNLRGMQNANQYILKKLIKQASPRLGGD